MGCAVSQSLAPVVLKGIGTKECGQHCGFGGAKKQDTACSQVAIINNENIGEFDNERVLPNNSALKNEHQTSSPSENLLGSQHDIQKEVTNSQDSTANEKTYSNGHHVNQQFNTSDEIVKDLKSDSTCQFDKRDEIIREIEEYGTHSNRRSGGVVFYVPIDLSQNHSNKSQQCSSVKNKDITKENSKTEAIADKSVPDQEDMPSFAVNTTVQKNEDSKKYNIQEKMLMADILREESILKRATIARQSQERFPRACTRRLGIETKSTKDGDNAELDQEIDSLGLRPNKPQIKDDRSNSIKEDIQSHVENKAEEAKQLESKECPSVTDAPEQVTTEAIAPVTNATEHSTESGAALDFCPSKYTVKELNVMLKESRKCVSQVVRELKKISKDSDEYRQKKQEAVKSVMIYEQAKIEWRKRQRQMDRKKCPQEYVHSIATSSSDINVKTT